MALQLEPLSSPLLSSPHPIPSYFCRPCHSNPLLSSLHKEDETKHLSVELMQPLWTVTCHSLHAHTYNTTLACHMMTLFCLFVCFLHVPTHMHTHTTQHFTYAHSVTDMFMEQSRLYSRTGSVFGAKKKRNTHPFFSGSDSFKPTSKFSSSVNCSSSHMLSSSSTWYSMMSGHSRQIKAKTLTFGRPKLTLNPPPLCSRKSKTIVTSESDSADGPHETEEVLHNDVDDLKLSKPGDDGVDVSERYTAGDSREQSILHLSAGKGDIGKGPIMMKSKTTGKGLKNCPSRKLAIELLR